MKVWKEDLDAKDPKRNLIRDIKKKGIVKKTISVFLISYDNGHAIDLQNVHFQV